MLQKMEREAKDIRKDTLNMCWHMRGGISYTEAMMLSPFERTSIANLIKDHFETTKKTGLPYY